jgi:transposase-like protein
MAKALWHRRSLRCYACQVSLAAGFHMSKMRPRFSLVHHYTQSLSMLPMRSSSFRYCRHPFPLYKPALSKHLGVSWPTARSMLKKIRTAMVHRDSLYRLVDELIELDDTYVGGKKSGKRGRGAKGKKPILVAVEHKAKTAGFVAMKAVESVSGKEIKSFLEHHLNHGQKVRTDAFPAMNIIEESHQHEKKITPPKEVSTWLPLVHIVIGNMKTFLNGTFHGVTQKYLQEYLDEFCYRFNRRFWEPELPLRLLNACLSHAPVTS